MTLIGARAHEKTQKQPIIVDATLEVDIEKGIQSDHIESTLDYSKVVQGTITFLEKSAYELLESLAYHLSHYLLESFSLYSVHLVVHKPHATNCLASVSVEYFCKKESRNK